MILPHRFEIGSSPCLASVLALLHLAALASLLTLQIPVMPKMALAAAILISLVMAVRYHALRNTAASVCELVLKDDGTVEGLRNDGERFEARISGQTTILSWLVVILLELPGTRLLHPLVILPDTISAENGRLLRAWLRWELS